jgi:predicted metal-dependent TIM-barrel fold hydrolase
MLDPALHTLDFVQTRSALLTSTVLALGSIALETFPNAEDEQVEEALKLHAHVEKLNLVIYSTGARSMEIVQAQIVSETFNFHVTTVAQSIALIIQ